MAKHTRIKSFVPFRTIHQLFSFRNSGRFRLLQSQNNVFYSTVFNFSRLFWSSLCCENDSGFRRSHCCEQSHSYALMIFFPLWHSVQPNAWLSSTLLALKMFSVIFLMDRAPRNGHYFSSGIFLFFFFANKYLIKKLCQNQLYVRGGEAQTTKADRFYAVFIFTPEANLKCRRSVFCMYFCHDIYSK